MCHENQQWTEALPLVLLGIRAAFKEDPQTSVAELVYSGSSASHNQAPPTHVRHQANSGNTPLPLRLYLCTANSRNARTSSSVRTQRAGFWSPPTAAPTGSCHGERKHCNSSNAPGPSLCQEERVKPAYMLKEADRRTTTTIFIPRGEHNSGLSTTCRAATARHANYMLRTSCTMYVSLLASTSEHPSARGEGVGGCGSHPQ
jgi:hypothetical protein